MKHLARLCAIVALSLVMLLDSNAAEKAFTPQQLNFFEKKIRPVLVESCYECHSADEMEGDLRVDLRAGLLQGGETGPAIVPKNLGDSLLIAAIEYRDDLEMPPDERLSDSVIRDFKRWVKMGAPDPRSGAMEAPSGKDAEGKLSGVDLWSLQPIQSPALPSVKQENWPQSGVDRFLLSKMEEVGVRPVQDASPEALLRRVSFDLTGLPPSLEDVRAFLKDPSEAAYQKYVDKLLKSPQFGERWARHWFDIARYAESAGSSRDVLMPYAWRYRDYVIDAMNEDIPYDRFITEQVAGDLLDADDQAERDRLQVATGFLAIGSKSLNGGNIVLDVVDDQIDVIGKAVLGMTISCARCHDHKFDPIPTADYYAMAGIFKSTQTLYGGSTNRPKDLGSELKVYLPLGNEASLEEAKKYISVEKELAKLVKKKGVLAKEVQKRLKALPKDWKQQEQALLALLEEEQGEEKISDEQVKLQEKIAAFRTSQQEQKNLTGQLKEMKTQEKPSVDWAVGVREGKKIADSPIHIRGEQKKTGDVVSRGFLSVVKLESEGSKISGKVSGRKELAVWLVDPSQPLTPRVAVNRIWMHLFGKGLVEQVDNFGTTSQPASHSELLDHLAHRFVRELGWSRKAIIREIVLSRAYKLSSLPDGTNLEKDAENQFYWRRQRRRLEAEALRDAMLQAGGELNLERPRASIVTQIGEGEVGRNINAKLLDKPYPYRSVYLPIIRGLVPEFLKVFDFPEPSNPSGTRMTTNVPSQSLFLMNSPFVIEQSEKLSELLIKSSGSDSDRVELMYLRALSRMPKANEIALAEAYLGDCRAGLGMSQEAADKREKLAWATLCQAVMASAEFRYLD